MSTQTATRISTLIEMLNLQTRLFSNAISGISEEHAHQRLNENTNHIAWLAGHIVSSRFAMANLAGLTVQEPYPDLFGNGKGIESQSYPSMSEMTKDWNDISEKLVQGLAELPESTLSEKAPFDLPFGDPSLHGAFAFFVHHEAYTIGQIGIARRYFGYEAMKYA